jgi:hypothetical protein
MTLTDFVEARIREDEAVARAVESDRNSVGVGVSTGDDPWPSERSYALRFTTARVLAECEAKRAIVALHPPKDVEGLEYLAGVKHCGGCWRFPEDHAVGWPCQTLRALAAIYSDHEDYRAEWRP